MRDDILDAARELLAEKGSVDAVSVRAVADRVGVSPPAIYLHFATKDALFYQSCRRTYSELAERLVTAVAGGETVLERLDQMARAYIRFGLEQSGDYRVLFSGEGPPDGSPADDPGVQSFELLVGMIRGGIVTGEIRADLDPEAAAVAVWGAVHGVVLLVLERVRLGLFSMELPAEDKVVETLLGLIRAGLGSGG